MGAVDFAAFVDELATVAGEAILPFFRTTLGVENKSKSGVFDPVTAADRAAEQAMRTVIRKAFPQHGIVGEEFGSEREDAEYVWVLDPIDGTKSFIAGFPIWGTLIAMTVLLVALLVIPFVDRGPNEPDSTAAALNWRKRGWAFLAMGVFWVVMIVGVIQNALAEAGWDGESCEDAIEAWAC